MSYFAYINGNLLDLPPNLVISQTKQVNDIANLENRQSNFTHKFTVLKTDNNVRNLDRMSLVGNQSNLPYKKNTFDLIDAESGLHLIYKGWAIVNSNNKGYEINAYDGIIDFYKLIENKTIGGFLDLSEINHEKTTANVVNSFTSGLNYKYLIADYNGKTHHNNKVNIDYLAASAKISYLWNKIFATFGYTYSGLVFNDEKFRNLWITYPKGISEGDPTSTVVYSRDNISNPSFSDIINTGVVTLNVTNVTFLFNQNATIIIDLANTFNYTGFDVYNEQFINMAGTVYAYKNGGLIYSRDMSGSMIFTHSFNAGDVLSFSDACNMDNNVVSVQPTGSFTNVLIKKINTSLSFSEELSDFYVKDFFKEVLNLFGLTPFKKKHSNHIDFLKLEEIIVMETAIDWSAKFIGVISEKNKLGDYAKENIFSYQYNDELNTYNNSKIKINNENLEDFKTVIESITFSPSNEYVSFAVQNDNVNTLIFQQYDKEIQDNGTIKYKPLSKRFYFQRSSQRIGTVDFTSEKLLESVTASEISLANFNQLEMDSIISDSYLPLQNVLKKVKVLEVEFNLNSFDVEQFTFKQIIYVEQLASYFMVNKISNFLKNKSTKVELIKAI
ncbi:hypothetical protein AAIP36_000320 [Flavobacterium psychrophilum]